MPHAKSESTDFDDAPVSVHSGGSTGSGGAGAEEGTTRKGFFNLIKHKIGLDVTSITLPVSFCEPTTTLIRMAEIFYFADILEHAADLPSSTERLAYVALFYATGFAFTERFDKPFNPVLGETYEWIDERIGTHFISEQVSHHPPISAGFGETSKFSVWQETRPKTVFHGNSIDLQTGTKTVIIFKPHNDVFTIAVNPMAKVHNILIGQSWIEHIGQMVVINQTTGEKATVNFEKHALFDKHNHVVKGVAEDKTGKPAIEISGQWSKQLSLKFLYSGGSIPAGTDKIMWTKPSGNSNGKHKLSDFVLRLLAMPPGAEGTLPPTDSRLRADRMWMEKGNTKEAGKAKNAVEEKQREEKALREKGQLAPYSPKWFELVPPKVDGLGPEPIWAYKGGYLESKKLATAI